MPLKRSDTFSELHVETRFDFAFKKIVLISISVFFLSRKGSGDTVLF